MSTRLWAPSGIVGSAVFVVRGDPRDAWGRPDPIQGVIAEIPVTYVEMTSLNVFPAYLRARNITSSDDVLSFDLEHEPAVGWFVFSTREMLWVSLRNLKGTRLPILTRAERRHLPASLLGQV